MGAALGLELGAEAGVTERDTRDRERERARARERERCCAVWRRTGRRKESYNVGVPTSPPLPVEKRA